MNNDSANFTPEKITEILRDKYHNNLSAVDIRKKHGISQKVWNEINKKFGSMFIKKFGKKTPERVNISVDSMSSFWGNDKRQDMDTYESMYYR